MTASAEKPPGRRVLNTLLRPGPPSKELGQRTWRRRLGAAARMLAALALAGGVYAALIPTSQAQEGAPAAPALSERATEGKALYDASCISCHGPNAQGVQNRGPSLIGVGSAAVRFQVETGRMPLARQGAQADEKAPIFTNDQAQAMGEYVQALGGGPQLPGGDYGGGDVANGGALFRVNCSSCHGFSGGGGALSSGKWAPNLGKASPEHMYAAMLTGPQSMPVFGDSQLTPQEKKDVISYVRYMFNDQDPGGYGLGRIGPFNEGLAIFLVGTTAMCFAALWIAGKS
ncbi:MAG: c-type cytochrome [Longispora sp.]|nr:c-type cytochrome [Longispora sp. (in: high G+C Gram-positive bacteria)]